MRDAIRSSLKEAYRRRAHEREARALEAWRLAERQRVLRALQAAGLRSLLELGAGPGKDAEFFQAQGLEVSCTDLCPEMVALCQSKGLQARVMDIAELDIPEASVDAVYAVNCLLHLPTEELPRVLAAIHRVLRPGGLFYLGVYGGREHEGVWEEDIYEPKRFFALRTDARMLALVSQVFAVESFDRIDTGENDGLHFQAFVLKRH